MSSIWIKHPVTLSGVKVSLVPLDRSHFDALVAVAADSAIWEFMAIDGTNESWLRQEMSSFLLRRATGEQYPFAVIDNFSGNIIGATMFHNIFPAHRKLEIGWTWYHSSYWRTGINRECKLLLLDYCFDVLKTVRVQFMADVNNVRSCTAIAGIGATYEGLLRNERIRVNGTLRSSAIFSILDAEWNDVRAALVAKIR